MKSIGEFLGMMLFMAMSTVFVSTSLYAAEAGKVILLTSIQSPQSLFHPDPYWAEAEAEKIFNQAFSQSGYQVETVRHASAWQLYQALHDPSAVGVFWLSHAAAPTQLNSMLNVSDAIVTFDGQDVKSLFQDVRPTVRFLAVIGCNDETTLTQYRKQGYYDRNPLLRIVSFADKVNPAPALIYALNQSIGSWGAPRLSDFGPNSREPNGDPDWMHDSIPTIRAGAIEVSANTDPSDSRELGIVVTRQVPDDADAGALSDLIFTSQGRFLGILPKPAPGEFQSVRMLNLSSNPSSPLGRILVSARPAAKKADFRGMTMRSLESGTTYLPLSYQGNLIGTDSALFLPQH